MTKKETDLVSVQPEMLSFVDKADLSSLEYEALVEMGLGVNEVKTYASWLLGKLGDAVAIKFGDVKKYSIDIGQNYTVLWNYTGAYRKYTKEDPDFSPDKYYGKVTWGMIYLVSQNSDKPVTLLNELADKGVRTMEGAYRAIKTKQTGKELPKKPKLLLHWNEETNKWRIDINEEDLTSIDWTYVKEQLMSYLGSLV